MLCSGVSDASPVRKWALTCPPWHVRPASAARCTASLGSRKGSSKCTNVRAARPRLKASYLVFSTKLQCYMEEKLIRHCGNGTHLTLVATSVLINLSASESAVAELEKNFIAAIESTYTQDVEGLESLLEAFGSQFHPRHYLVLIVKWLLVVYYETSCSRRYVPCIM